MIDMVINYPIYLTLILVEKLSSFSCSSSFSNNLSLNDVHLCLNLAEVLIAFNRKSLRINNWIQPQHLTSPIRTEMNRWTSKMNRRPLELNRRPSKHVPQVSFSKREWAEIPGERYDGIKNKSLPQTLVLPFFSS